MQTGQLLKNLGLFFILNILLVTTLVAEQAPPQTKEEESLFVAEKAFEDGFYDVSLSLLERFLSNYPASTKITQVELLIGRCYFYQNRFLDALKKFEGLLAQPASQNLKDEIYFWIAEVHFKGSNFAKAAAYYQKIIEEFPKSVYLVSAYYSLGWCQFQENNFSQALENFKLLEEKFGGQPQAQDAVLKIIECLYNLKDYAALKERVKSDLKAYGRDPLKIAYLYFYLAEADYYLNNFSDAQDEYSKAFLNTKDEKIQALSKLGMGWAYLKLKRFPEAETAFWEVKNEDLEGKSVDILLLGKAILAFETEKFSQAKNLYAELVNLATDKTVLMQAYLGWADALYNLGEYAEAVKVYQEAQEKLALELDARKEAAAAASEIIPKELSDRLHYGLAWAFLKEGEFRQAIKEFQKVAQQSQDVIVKISALCQIGDTYQESADYAKAQEVYDKILKDYPDSFYGDYVQYQLGLALLKSANYDGAIMSFANLKKNFPQSKLLDDASYALGLTYFQRQDYNSSREVFQNFKDEFKDSGLRPQAIYLLGTSLYNLQKFSESIEVFKNIIRTYGQDSELIQKAEYEIADCYYQMGNEKEAMSRFNALRAKYPDSSLTAEVMWWLGEYYYRHNDLILARRYFSSLIQDFPQSNLVADAHYALGTIYNEETNYPEAINSFKKVIELSKSDLAGQAAIAIADIYVHQDQTNLAIDTYHQMAKDYPDLIHLIYPKLADTYFKTGDYPKAIELYRKSLEIIPFREMAQVQFKIAECLQAEGKSEEAIEEYLKVTYLYPQDSGLLVKSLLRVAKFYEDQENFKEAVNIYNRVAAIDIPEAKYAKERLEALKQKSK